jgi:hypothetical protein
MKIKMSVIKMLLAASALLVLFTFPGGSSANHSWGGYHWARTSNPFTVKLNQNLTSEWVSYLQQASNDWTASSVLNTTIQNTGNYGSRRKCSPVSGQVVVCNESYGQNGWLGIASVWTSGGHIVQGTVKMNDTYYAMARYNTPAWRMLVMCQEIGHTFGLAHQDETFGNYNLGTCMDYTNAPSGGTVNGFNYGPSNEHPNSHDYNQLVSIYSHNDSTTTTSFTAPETGNSDTPEDWGTPVAKDNHGRDIIFERELGYNNKKFTFVFWAEEPKGNRPEDH